jgi:hypothetical protein
MASQQQTAAGVVFDITSNRFFVWVPEKLIYLPLDQAAGLVSQAQLGAALGEYLPLIGGELSGPLALPEILLGGESITADENGLYFAGEAVSINGQGHYLLKGVTRLYLGTSMAIGADVRAALIRGVGGGGGGGGAQGGVAGGAAGGGGAGGAYFEAWKTDIAGQTLSYAIGAGGAGGTTSGGNGGTGGDTSISLPSGWVLTAQGGVGGNGQSNGNWAQATAGGYGQNASGGDLNIGGEAGNGGIRMDAQNNLAGKGAGSRFGAGGQAFAGNAAGQQGLGYGAGGGGGAVAANATGRAGGAGSSGYIEIWEFA